MTVRHYASESYTEVARGGAWREVLAELGLRSGIDAGLADGYATAVLRGAGDRLIVGRLTAAAQSFRPARGRGRLSCLVLPLDDGARLTRAPGLEATAVEPGSLVLLPAAADWSLTLDKTLPAIVLCVGEAVFNGRRTGLAGVGQAEIAPTSGLVAILAGLLRAVSDEVEHLSTVEWQSLEQSLAELYLTVVLSAQSRHAADAPAVGSSGLLHRITRTIEQRLADPDLSAVRVARLEGISERYLQKLFEETGESFGLYLRERRLQAARATLSEPRDVGLAVSDIAYACGFSDPANFNRLFKARFGQSPGVFRKQATRPDAVAATSRADQRGWPVEALTAKAMRPPPRSMPVPEQAGTAERPEPAEGPVHHHLPVRAAHVHWGFFSRSLSPVLEIASGDTVTVETMTQHASDDHELMIRGDPAAEEIFRWGPTGKTIDRRGAGPMDASIFGRGAGEGFGVHICTGPIAIRDAEPGDVVEVRILDMQPRPSLSPGREGRCFASSAAAWWGYHYRDLVERPKPRETITVYEIFPDAEDPYATALYAYRWAPQTDPFGIVHRIYDYPGVPVDTRRIEPVADVLTGIRIPLRPHFGVIGLAPREAPLVDSVPPAYFGGNLDNWRLGRGAAVYLPVSVPGGLLSIGDPHATQGDGEVAGTAIECSMTGRLAIRLHKKAQLPGRPIADLTYPIIETPTDWVLTGFSHPNYLAEFGAKGQSEVYSRSSLDLAMADAFRKTRRFLMSTQGLSEDEAVSLMSAAIDFGVTQVVDGNWGVHAIIRKTLLRRAAD
ncbi:acetamidase/formamidase family protein [Mangrovibrevibacter kandeliae]|uniref:acetamidase/formamidase family protein n=1 Tax=Mangrovibrevibacter kandeliae TaxID=2968473 RepID=UPI00211820FC|nr:MULTISPECIES: acetamidase/formamidase family protein [unclassified Aurantimonas]MCQ8781590.1 acetamidase/formamidase family protein [Aurantimonas sp. CSK15Z-1]MCW4114964.1 acetamidase/formamidase family protein [Aurantimonas sp. MSK8Z-1]